MTSCVFAQNGVDGGGRKPEPFEPPRCGRVTDIRLLARQRFKRIDAALALGGLQFADGARGGIAVDAFSNQIADETHVADRFAFSLDVELRVETVVDETITFTSRDRFANDVVFEALALEPLPELRLG